MLFVTDKNAKSLLRLHAANKSFGLIGQPMIVEQCPVNWLMQTWLDFRVWVDEIDQSVVGGIR